MREGSSSSIAYDFGDVELQMRTKISEGRDVVLMNMCDIAKGILVFM